MNGFEPGAACGGETGDASCMSCRHCASVRWTYHSQDWISVRVKVSVKVRVQVIVREFRGCARVTVHGYRLQYQSSYQHQSEVTVSRFGNKF